MLREDLNIEPVLFSSGIPSNFYRAYITLPNPMTPTKDTEFATNEHYFQACKVALSNQGTIDMYREIVFAPGPADAKKLGRQVPLDQEALDMWNHHESLVAMLECNLAKFTQHKKCQAWLRKTVGRPLIEHRRDRIWGDNLDGTGLNLLGKTLELVRARVC